MESLIIKQNTALLETVNNDTIHNLYTTAKTLKDANKLVTLEGNLLSLSAYERDVNYLTTTFSNLYITASTLYVNFEDPEVERLLKSYGYGDSTGIRTSDLLTITRLNPNGKFADYSTITSFNELSRFINLKRIYTEDFRRTDSLTSIDLLNIERIDERAFLQSAIQTVNAPNLTTLANDAFSSSKVTTVTSLGEITEIPAGCFSGCSYLTSVNIPDTCTSIKNITFLNCTALTTIDLNNVVRTDNATFKGCTNLATVTSSDNLTTVGYQSFLNCKSLLSIDLSNATSLNIGSFENCTSLLSVVLADGLTTIPNSCFYNCTSLTSINMPSSVKTIGNQAFNYTTANLLQGSDLANIEGISGHADNGNGAFAPGSFANENLVLPNLKTLYGCVFSKCSFKTISIPNLESISSDVRTFSDNAIVTKIHVNPNVIVYPHYGSRGTGIFGGCSNLVKVTGLSLYTECYTCLFSGDKNLKYFDIDFTKITRLCGGLFKSDVGSISNYFNSNRIIDFENLVHSYIDNNGNLTYAKDLFTCCILSHVCFPKLKETTATKDRNAYGAPGYNFFVMGTKCGRIKNLYFRDIENFGVATFSDAIVDNLYLDTSTPPGLIPSTGSAAPISGINDDVFFGLRNKSAYTNSALGITAPAITIYVPDSAVSTYLANPLYASVASNIVGISNAPVVSLSDITDIIDPDDNDPTITYGQACSVDGILPLYAPARTL